MTPGGHDRGPLTFLLRAAGAFIVVTALLLAWVPIYASGVVARPARIAEGQAPGSGPLERMHIEIQAHAEGTQLRLPNSVSTAARYGRSQVHLGAWWRDTDDPALVTAAVAGSVLRIVGAFDTLEFGLVTGPQPRSLELRLSGTDPVVVSLQAERPGIRTFSARNGQQRITGFRRFAWSGRRILFSEPADRVEKVNLAFLTVEHRPVLSPDGRLIGVEVPRAEVLKALVGTARRAIPLLLTAAALCIVSMGLGNILERTLTRSSTLRWALWERLPAGMAAGLSIVGVLNYFVPVWFVTPMVALLGIVGFGLGFRLERRPHWRLGTEGSTLIGAVLGFIMLPQVVTDRWAIGFWQTDVYDTFNLTQLFWDRSALAAGTLFGNGFRLLDYSSRAAVGGWGRPSDAVVVLRLATSVIMIAVIWQLMARLSNQPWLRCGVTFAVCLSGPLLALYAEGYLTRDFFVGWMIIGLALLLLALHDGRTGWSAWAPAATAFALAAAVVPPYFVIAPAIPVAATLIRYVSRQPFRELGRTYRKPAIGAAAVWASATIPNLLWLRHAGDAQQYIPSLNALARYSVIPFYDTIRFPATLLGVLPFHANGSHPFGRATDVTAPEPLLFVLRLLEKPVAIGMVTAVLLVAVVAAARVAVDRRRETHPSLGIDATWISGLAVIAFGFGALRLTQWNQQTYFVLMWAWTLAPIGVLLMSIGMASAFRRASRGLRVPILLGILALTGVNLLSAILESSRWLENPHGHMNRRWHFSLVSDVQPFAKALDDGILPLSVRYKTVEQLSSLTGSDRDRVLSNVLVGLLDASGHSCVNCRRVPDTHGLVLDEGAIDQRLSTIVIGGRGCPGAVSYRGERFVVCAPGG